MFMAVVGLVFAVVWWGLKLEGELNSARDALNNVRQQVGNGILPRAEERINSLTHDLQSLQKQLDRHIDDESDHGGMQ
jgi:DNA repair exonuclease SbcCD ATPase subunit